MVGHDNSPYSPLPFASGIGEGIADSGYQHPQLLPKFTLADGSELIGTAYLKNIQQAKAGNGYKLSYRQDALTKLGKNEPVKDERITLETEYAMSPGTITGTDKYTPAAALDVARLTLEFASFSDLATVEGNTVRFKQGGRGTTRMNVRHLPDGRATTDRCAALAAIACVAQPFRSVHAARPSP